MPPGSLAEGRTGAAGSEISLALVVCVTGGGSGACRMFFELLDDQNVPTQAGKTAFATNSLNAS